MSEPFAYIAIKNGACGGMCCHAAGSKELHNFISEFLSDGYSIKPVKDRAEYNATLDGLTGFGNASTGASHV